MFNVAQFSSAWWSEAFGPETTTYSQTVGSTQTQAKNHLSSECSNHGHFFIAGTQTNGKGRGENTWTSPSAESALMASILQKIPSSPQPIITPLFGWAVYKSLQEAFPNANFSIKAPNDIYLNNKKVAGLLLDSVSQGDNNWIIYGIGVNVFSTPNVPDSISLVVGGADVNEDSWSVFLRSLSSDLTLVNQMSLNKELKPQYIKEITKGLKNYPLNNVKNLTPMADLILEDESVISWRDL